MYWRCPSANTVSNAKLLFPEPLGPVITTRRSRGMSKSMFCKLWTRAPRTRIVSSADRQTDAGDAVAQETGITKFWSANQRHQTPHRNRGPARLGRGNLAPDKRRERKTPFTLPTNHRPTNLRLHTTKSRHAHTRISPFRGTWGGLQRGCGTIRTDGFRPRIPTRADPVRVEWGLRREIDQRGSTSTYALSYPRVARPCPSVTYASCQVLSKNDAETVCVHSRDEFIPVIHRRYNRHDRVIC